MLIGQKKKNLLKNKKKEFPKLKIQSHSYGIHICLNDKVKGQIMSEEEMEK
jgi:hypothetical protein